MSHQIPEQDWRAKQKAMDDLMQTVELQKKALDTLQKDIREKEKLCSALRVSTLLVFILWMSKDGCGSIVIRMFVSYKGSDDILGITT